MNSRLAGIDVHKRVLMVVVIERNGAEVIEKRRFGATTAELDHLRVWLRQQEVDEVVMESTAQYWKPVWLSLEAHFALGLAQAWSNRAPRGKKNDFKDAERLARRQLAGELTLSFIPEAEQRQWRSLTRRRTQLTRDCVRIQNQVESLLEEMRIKLSSVVTDLFGASGQRILAALVKGEASAAQMATLADARVQCDPELLTDALNGTVTELHRKLLQQHLSHRDLLQKQLEELTSLTADALKPHSDAVTRLAEIPGIRTLAAQQILAEVGHNAKAFPSAAQFSSWIGVCPGQEESAEQNHSSHSTKGNSYLRRTLCQAAQAAVRTNNSIFQIKFRRFLPKHGYVKSIWAIARHLSVVIWTILHEGVRYIEHGGLTTPGAAKRRLQRLKKELRNLGYSDALQPLASTVTPA
jgi:transposase